MSAMGMIESGLKPFFMSSITIDYPLILDESYAAAKAEAIRIYNLRGIQTVVELLRPVHLNIAGAMGSSRNSRIHKDTEKQRRILPLGSAQQRPNMVLNEMVPGQPSPVHQRLVRETSLLLRRTARRIQRNTRSLQLPRRPNLRVHQPVKHIKHSHTGLATRMGGLTSHNRRNPDHNHLKQLFSPISFIFHNLFLAVFICQ